MRDVSVRYKQTVVGVGWAIIRPFLATVIFTIIFGSLAGLPSEQNAPYALMVYAGILPWTLISSSLSDASNSLVNNSNLISKIYFPRLIVPAASFAVAFVDFLISFFLFLAVMLWYQWLPNWQIVLLPLFLMQAVLVCSGPALWITALNVKYRDFRHLVPFIVQFGLYISPVGFSSSIIPEKYRLLYSLNPVVGTIDGFRWCLLGEGSVNWPGFLLSCLLSILLLWVGITKFRKMEKHFADLI